MKFTLLLWILPSISAYLYHIEDLSSKCPDSGGKDEMDTNGYTQFYAIPAKTDTKPTFQTIEVKAGSDSSLEYPETETISSIPIGEGDVPQICYHVTSKPDVTGVIYFVEEDYADMDVYQSRGEDYPVEISKKYTTVFSQDIRPNSIGSTLGSFVTDKDTSFEIHSGLPGDNDNLIFQYDSSQKVDQLYIAQNYFYILNSGGKTFNFTVSDKIVDPSTTTFGLNGFIMSPNFPATPPGNYEDLKVALKTREVEKILKLKVTTIQSSDAVKTGEEGIVLDEEPSIYVEIGDFNRTIETNSTAIITKFSVTLPTTANTIEIKSVNSAYTVQFDIEDLPTSTTATPSTTKSTITPCSTTKPTATPKPVTSGTCPPTTCPVVTCPVSTPCSCLTTTTEISTTTMGASTLSLTMIANPCQMAYNAQELWNPKVLDVDIKKASNEMTRANRETLISDLETAAAGASAAGGAAAASGTDGGGAGAVGGAVIFDFDFGGLEYNNSQIQINTNRFLFETVEPTSFDADLTKTLCASSDSGRSD